MNRQQVWVVGHKNPDTDSICAAIAYANLKNQLHDGYEYVPKRAGDISAETACVLSKFGVEAPEYIEDAGTQLKDIAYRKIPGVSHSLSMKLAWEMMRDLNIVTLPVVNSFNQLEGLIVTGDIAKSYMDVYDNAILSRAKTQYKNICETIEGTILTGNPHGCFVTGKVTIAASSLEVADSIIEKDDLVIVGDNEAIYRLAIRTLCRCIIVTNNLKVSDEILKEAEEKEIVIISTPYDTFTVARLINQSMPIKFFMTKRNIVAYELDDYVVDVKKSTAKIRHRYFPIVDEDQNYVGMFSPRNLLDVQKKKLILVDHNEKTQAVANVEDAEILEIIDHHRLGSLETIAPVYFRNQPLGCTSTIVYQMYQEQGIEISPTMAGLLCAAILSDTLMFRSPTCTIVDRVAAEALAQIAGFDTTAFALQMFEAGSDLENKTPEEILNQDFKIFHYGSQSFGVSQVMALGQMELEKVGPHIREELKRMRVEKRVDMLFVMHTDILTDTTELLFYGDGAYALVKEAFQKDIHGDCVILEGMVSRKKQLIPALMSAFERV